jgi:predicted KAP-like P-loop ATPase
MWNDTETTKDLLNFGVIADTAAQMILNASGEPVSIGVSGKWGTGKSSLVKMIGESLKKTEGADDFIFIDFNAWLYQGYDDARMALLQMVADRLLKEAEKRETVVDKAKDFVGRIDWLRTAKLLVPVAKGAITGAAIGGPVGGFIGAVSGLFSKGTRPTDDDLAKLQESYNAVAPELHEILKEKKAKSIPKEISALRTLFTEILDELKITLVVLVDDLDRCLSRTAISTLEAMRLLLFMPRTAFIIAADEEMIRNAVRAHFGDVELNDDLVTSYFDKLIQIPLRVPRLSTNEVKAYVVLLLADLAARKAVLTEEERAQGETAVLDAIKKAWSGGLTRKVIEDAYGEASKKIAKQIDIADQLANIMATSDHIAGNPRLIKRFLNDLIIREIVAEAQGMTVSFEELVKLQLFERCAPATAFEFLAKAVGESEDGKATFIADLESKIAKGEDIVPQHDSWKGEFISNWLKLNPPLGDIDLRPLLYLSRDKAVSMATYDDLSKDGRELLSALCDAHGYMQLLVDRIKLIGETEAATILGRMKRKARKSQWESAILIQAVHVPKAFRSLGESYIEMLNEIPGRQRNAAIIPQIRDEDWAQATLTQWAEDAESPKSVKTAIAATRR